jgi:hypothetical protein
MKISGLLLCDKCGVYEFMRWYTQRPTKKVFLEIHYWSNIPAYKLKRELCPRCNPGEPFFQVNEHWG